jgi:arylsulfatase A-like enzyme
MKLILKRTLRKMNNNQLTVTIIGQLAKFTAILMLFLHLGTGSYAQKPNILWITIEDTSPQFIGCYGNDDASTPVIDQLAEEGVRFTNAFSTGSVCSTSRSTIITGVRTYELGTGNHRSQYPIPEHIKGFPYYLQQQGYYVTNNSKTDYNLKDEKEFIKEAWHESSPQAGWWDRGADQPFFAVFNYNDSHQSRTMTHSYSWYEQEVLEKLPTEQRIGEDEFEMPPFYRDSPEMRQQFARVYNSIKLTDNKIGDLLDRLKKDKLMDDTIILFFADHGEGIPRGKTNGINLGYRVPMIAWFPPKYRHLSPWGTGMVSEELISFEDLAPTMVSLSGGDVPEHLNGRILMGEGRSEPVDKLFLASDRSDNGIDMIRTVTNGRYVYSRNFMPFMPEARYIRYMEIGDIKQLMRQDHKENRLNPLQKSLFEARPTEFLYDIENDLWETNNLAENPNMQTMLQEMRNDIKENIFRTKDVMFLPEYEIAQISSFTTPYQFRQDSDKYPLNSIYEAASLSGKRGEPIAKQQLEFLQNPSNILRYWAAVGLKSQSKEVLGHYKAEILEAVEDPYPPVAITASAIAYDLFQDKAAEEYLKKFSKSDNRDLALMAINYLLYVDNPQPFVETIQGIYQQEEWDYNISAASKDFLGSLGLIPNNFDYR